MTINKIYLLVVAAGALGACADQPKNRCKVAPGLGVAHYTRKGAPTGTCDGVVLPFAGESVGMQAFVPDPTLPDATNKPTNLTIKPAWLGERISEARDRAAADPALSGMAAALTAYPYASATDAPPPSDLQTTRRPYALGTFETVYPGDDGVCTLSKLNDSELAYPGIPAHSYPDPGDATRMVMVAATPATTVKYSWSNIRVIQIPLSPGTQTFADLTVTRDGCSASYGAAILVPRVDCGSTDAAGKVTANQDACNPSPNSTNLFGSGISQGVPTQCQDLSQDPAHPEQPDPANPSFVCVPTRTAP
jgi:hypothetical protein